MQGFDPIGVAARDLQECLWLQLRHIGLEGTPAERIVTEHLRMLQNHQIPELAKKLGLSVEDLKPHIETIRHLDPKPGSRFNRRESPVRHPGRVRGQGGRPVRGGAQRGRAAAAADQPRVPAAAREEHREPRGDAGLRQGQVPLGAVADQVGGAAAADDSQGRDEHHQLPAGLPRPRHRVPAPARAAGRGQRHLDARVDGEPRRHEQVHAHARRACSR